VSQQNELDRPSLVQVRLEESNGFLQSADMGPPSGSRSRGFDDTVVVVIDDNFCCRQNIQKATTARFKTGKSCWCG
jgi:hypothetical protein